MERLAEMACLCLVKSFLTCAHHQVLEFVPVVLEMTPLSVQGLVLPFQRIVKELEASKAPSRRIGENRERLSVRSLNSYAWCGNKETYDWRVHPPAPLFGS